MGVLIDDLLTIFPEVGAWRCVNSTFEMNQIVRKCRNKYARIILSALSKSVHSSVARPSIATKQCCILSGENLLSNAVKFYSYKKKGQGRDLDSMKRTRTFCIFFVPRTIGVGFDMR